MIRVLRDADELAREAAAHIVAIGRKALSERGRLNLLLGGGTTPEATYRTLAENTRTNNAFWRDTHLYWGDERLVPADSPESNVRMARETLVDIVPVPAENIHPVPVEIGDANAVASSYATLLPSKPDLVLLGLGEDAHIASLFPGSDAIRETSRRVAAVRGGDPLLWRITITPPVLTSAREVLVLVAGKRKAKALNSVFAKGGDARDIPGRLVRDRLWMADRAASRFLLQRARSGNVAVEIEDARDAV